ncbi:MAG: caspase domain-containing protein [Thiohalomonadales bacterium]
MLFIIAHFASRVYAADVYIPKDRIIDDAEPSYFIISIGINNYIDDYWSTLKWPASDATRIADKLGIKTNTSRITRLLINGTATLNNVKKALYDVSQQAGPNDIVILYISGHGTLAQTKKGELERIFLLHDSKQKDLFSTALPFSTLQNWLNRLQSRKNLMILATCHSGEGKSRLPIEVQDILSKRKGKLIALSDVSEGALILTAAAHNEAARENDKLQGDIYTYYLLEALSVYDRNKDGMTSALEAHDYARDRTWVFSNGRQRPTANIKLVGDADIPLMGTKSTTGLPILEAYSAEMAGFYIKVDDNIKGRLPSAFPLSPDGSYVTLLSPDDDLPIARYKVSAGAGQTLSLKKIMNHRPVRIGTSIKRSFWSDTGWERLTGSSTATDLEFAASYQFNSFAIGVLFNLPTHESNSIRPPIDASTDLRSTLITAEYQYRTHRLSFISRLEFGQEKLSFDLLDTVTNDQLYFTDTASSLGFSFITDVKIRKDISISGSIGLRDAGWNFGTVGDLSGQRRWFSIGVNYQFGWLARTL